MVPRLEEGSGVRVVRGPHRLLADLAGKGGWVKQVRQTENGRIFKVDVRGHGLVWFTERQLEALPEVEQVPEAEGGPQDPREVGP